MDRSRAHDLENLTYGDVNEIEDLEVDDDVELIGSNDPSTQPGGSQPPPPSTKRGRKAKVWKF